MNILILISSLEFGGAEKQAVIDANLLAQDHNVRLITFSGGPLEKQLTDKVNYQQLKKTGYLRTALKLHKAILNNKIDMIHASLFAAMILSALAALFNKTKVFWHFHSHEYDAPFYSKMAFMICSRMPAVKKITFVNKELKGYLSKRFLLPRGKLVLLYNSSGFESVEKKAVDHEGPLVIGYVGRLVQLKRVHYLITLAEDLLKSRFTDFEICIVGDGDEYDHLKNEVKSKALDKQLNFLGFQEDTEPLYRRFDLFILPSREECLSMALIDAGICGLPAIAFAVGGNNEIILNEKTGYIVSTLDDLIARSHTLIKDKELRLRFGNAAREHCEKEFSQKARKENLLALR